MTPNMTKIVWLKHPYNMTDDAWRLHGIINMVFNVSSWNDTSNITVTRLFPIIL